MSIHIYRDRPRESGSVIWFIMLAIALTAALTMTLTRSSDTGGSAGDIERARTQASQIMSYAGGLERAIEQAILRGVSENDVSFENSFVSGYQNTGCPDAAGNCRLFGGGGQTYMEPRADWLDAAQDSRPLYGEWYFAGNICAQDVGTGGTGCDADSESNEDLVLILPWIDESICRQINGLLGIAGDPPAEAGDGWSSGNEKFQGAYSDSVILNQAGRAAGCIEGAAAGSQPPQNTFSYYHVLIDR